MFRFWHIFIPRAIPAIEIDNGDKYYFEHVKPKLHEYMGEIFEQMCRHYLLLNAFSDIKPCPIMEVGKWNGSNHKKKEQTDIDVVGLDTEHNRAILGECKFRNSPIDKSIFETLMDRNGLIDKKYSTIAYFLFSLAGFSSWIEENCNDFNLKLVSLEDMYK